MKLIDYLPLVFQEVREFEAITIAQQPEVDKLHSELKIVEDNFFIASLDERGCERWESMLDITPTTTETLTDRRFAIQTKYGETLPYTWAALTARLDTMVGAGAYDLIEDTARYTLTLKIGLANKNQLAAVKKLMESLVPCNIILDIQLKYNTNKMLKAYTNGQLQAFTHSAMREEVFG